MIRKGDIYWVDLEEVYGYNAPHMQKGVRPCVVVSNKYNNEHNSFIQIMPLTTKYDGLPQHVRVDIKKTSYCMPEFLVSIPKSMLKEYYGNIHGKMYKFVEKAIKIQLGLWRGGEYERY